MSTGSAVLDFPVRRQTLGPAGAGVTLVVESDPGAAQSLLAQLFADGFRVELARTAEHARMFLVRRPPRLVVIGGLSRHGARWSCFRRSVQLLAGPARCR